MLAQGLIGEGLRLYASTLVALTLAGVAIVAVSSRPDLYPFDTQPLSHIKETT